MNVFLSIKFHADHSNRDRIEAILQVLEGRGMKTTCIMRDFERWGAVHYDPRDLMRITLREIRNAHLVVVELTEKGVGIGIEAGYAVARGIPIITIASHGEPVSTTLAGISAGVYYYTHPSELDGIFRHDRLQYSS